VPDSASRGESTAVAPGAQATGLPSLSSFAPLFCWTCCWIICCLKLAMTRCESCMTAALMITSRKVTTMITVVSTSTKAGQ